MIPRADYDPREERRYSPDQARDDHGKWGEGTSPGYDPNNPRTQLGNKAPRFAGPAPKSGDDLHAHMRADHGASHEQLSGRGKFGQLIPAPTNALRDAHNEYHRSASVDHTHVRTSMAGFDK